MSPCLLMLVSTKCLLLNRSTALIHQKSCQSIYFDFNAKLITFNNIKVAMSFGVSVEQVPIAV